VWTDDHVLVDPQWVAAYCRAFERWPDAAVFGGPIEASFAPIVRRSSLCTRRYSIAPASSPVEFRLTIDPVEPWTTASAFPPAFVAMHGRPEAIASVNASGNPSFSDESTKQSAASK